MIVFNMLEKQLCTRRCNSTICFALRFRNNWHEHIVECEERKIRKDGAITYTAHHPEGRKMTEDEIRFWSEMKANDRFFVIGI